MGKGKEEYNELSERYKKYLYQFVYCKSCQPCIHKSDIYWGDRKKLKNINPRCSSNKLAFNLFNSFLSCSYNHVRIKFVKLIGIYQLFVLLFYVEVAQADSTNAAQQNLLKQIKEQVEKAWEKIIQTFCKNCQHIGLDGDTCKQPYVTIPILVFLFLFMFGIICLICCKCCCKKSCCKKKENDESDESDVDYNNFIMGPDGQMYSTMCQEQMMQPQMFPTEMMYPQMYQGQMFYPQMLQEGMQQSDVFDMEMQQPATHKTKKKRKKKKRSSKRKNSNDDALIVGYNMM